MVSIPLPADSPIPPLIPPQRYRFVRDGRNAAVYLETDDLVTDCIE